MNASSLGGCERHTTQPVCTLLALFFAEGENHHRQQPVRLQLLDQRLPLAPAVNNTDHHTVRMQMVRAGDSDIRTIAKVVKAHARQKLAKHFYKVEVWVLADATDCCGG